MKHPLTQLLNTFVVAVLMLLPLPVLADDSIVIRVGGTGGALGSIRELARAFEKKQPGIRVMVPPSLGSSGGIKALLTGALDIAVTSRPPCPKEEAQGVSAREYARTPFIFVSSKKGAPGNLTIKQLVALYEGRMKTWPDGLPIRLILRPHGDTDNDYLKAMSADMEKAVQAALSREGMVRAVTDQENLDTIVKVSGALGAATLSQVVTEHRPVAVFRLNGVSPTVQAVANGSYQYYKCFYAVTGPNVSPAAQAFFSYLASPEGRAILERTGNLTGSFPACTAGPCRKQ